HAQRPGVTGSLRSRPERLAGAIGIHGVGRQSARHIGRRHLYDFDVVWRHALLREHLSEKQEIYGETAGNRDPLSAQLSEVLVRSVGANHDHGTRAMAERNDLDGYAAIG